MIARVRRALCRSCVSQNCHQRARGVWLGGAVTQRQLCRSRMVPAVPRLAQTAVSGGLYLPDASQTLLARSSQELTQRMRGSLCAVCKVVIDTIDKTITDVERKDMVKIEKKMFDWCATSKGKDKTMVSSHAAAHG